MDRFHWIKCWVLVAAVAAPPALGDDLHRHDVDACRRAADRVGADPSACFAAELRRIDQRLQNLLDQRARGLSSASTRDRMFAAHDRWQHAATAFCAGVAASEPMPSYTAAMLDCAVSLLADREATLRDELRQQQPIAGLPNPLDARHGR